MRLDDFLAGTAQSHTFKKGQIVFVKGAQAAAAFYVIEGAIEIFDEVAGQASVVATLHAGSIFGEMALLRFDHYTLSARASEETKVYVITPKMLQAELTKTHPLIRLIIDTLTQRMRDTNEVLIDLEKGRKNT